MGKNSKRSYSSNGFPITSQKSDARKELKKINGKKSLVTLTIQDQEPINGKIEFGTSVRSTRFLPHAYNESVTVQKYSKKYSRRGFHFIPNDDGKKLLIPLPRIDNIYDGGFTGQLEDYSEELPPIIMKGEIKLI